MPLLDLLQKWMPWLEDLIDSMRMLWIHVPHLKLVIDVVLVIMRLWVVKLVIPLPLPLVGMFPMWITSNLGWPWSLLQYLQSCMEGSFEILLQKWASTFSSQANARTIPFGFQRIPFPLQAPPPQKSNLKSMLESMLLAQQKQGEYIKQLAFKVDLWTTHNKMLESQIARQANSSTTPPSRLPSKPKRNPGEQ